MVITRNGSDTCSVMLKKLTFQRVAFRWMVSLANSFYPISILKSDRLRASGSLTYGRMWEFLKAKLGKL